MYMYVLTILPYKFLVKIPWIPCKLTIFVPEEYMNHTWCRNLDLVHCVDYQQKTPLCKISWNWGGPHCIPAAWHGCRSWEASPCDRDRIQTLENGWSDQKMAIFMGMSWVYHGLQRVYIYIHIIRGFSRDQVTFLRWNKPNVAANRVFLIIQIGSKPWWRLGITHKKESPICPLK